METRVETRVETRIETRVTLQTSKEYLAIIRRLFEITGLWACCRNKLNNSWR